MKNLFLSLLFFAHIFVHSQTNLWSDFYGCRDTQKMQYTSKNIGYYSINATSNGRIIKTTDGGNSFQEISIFKNKINYFYFADDNSGYLVDQFNILYKTSDGGATWINLSATSVGYGFINKMFFFSKDIGFTLDSSNFAYKTTNGGATWNSQANISGDRFFVLNDKTGWLSNSKTGQLYKTNDSGNSWTLIFTNSSLSFQDIFFSDSLNGWFLSTTTTSNNTYEKIYKTNDGGHTWNIILDNPSLKLRNFVFSDNLTGIAINTTDIFKTTDGGYTWNSTLNISPLHGTYTATVFDNNYYVSGPIGFRIHSSDGNNWNDTKRLTLAPSFSSYNSKLIADNGILYTVGYAYESSTLKSEYYISKVNSDGSNYESKRTGIPVTGSGDVVYQLNFNNENSNWFLNSLPFRSTDKGNSWTPLYNTSSPTTNYRFTALNFFDNNNGIALGNGNIRGIYKTNNSGNSWEIVKNLESPLNLNYGDIHFFDENNGISINIGDIVKTYDGGKNWETKFLLPASDYGGFNELYFLNNDLGFAMGAGKIAKTINGGETWDLLNTDSFNGCSSTDIFFINPTTGWITTACGIYKTNDGAQTWTKETNTMVERILMFDENNGYALTSEGLYYKYQPNPSPTYLTDPVNNQTDVSLDKTITWQKIQNAQGYYVSMGKTLQYENFKNTITSNNYLKIPTQLQPNTTYYISIIPFNSANEATGNTVYKFTTGTLGTLETSKKTFDISPNPTKDILYISNNKTSKFKIHDVSAKIIKQGNIENGMIDIRNFTNGIYFIEVDKISKKIIKN